MSGDQGYRFFAAGFRRGNHLRVFPPAKGMVDPPWGHPDHLRLCSDETLKKKRAVIPRLLIRKHKKEPSSRQLSFVSFD